MIFALTDKNKEALENYTELWNEIRDQIELISGNKPIEYRKNFMKISFESDDDLPLGKILHIPVCAIIVRSVKQNFSISFIDQLYKVSFIFAFVLIFFIF